MEADLEEQLRTGAVKDKTSGTKGYFGTTFNPNDYSIVHNLTDNDKQNFSLC
ncbi:MAG: hypothetical protein KatS3mg083_255 [Candidatus Dojkabacteria bacterium]|nr:MAG: hypothetical protein KatS3mg083_255 [Candidatus Dojkabacteria bacterium]